MGNMGYCRFQNTLAALSDCVEHAGDDLSEDEHIARNDLIGECVELLEAFGVDPDEIRSSVSYPEDPS